MMWGVLVVAPVITLLWLLAGPGPKYEEIFGLITLTVLLALVAIGAGVVRPRPLRDAVLFGACCAVLWTGTVAKVAWLYSYRMLDLPALYLGLGVAAVGALAVAGWHGLMRLARRAVRRAG